MIPKQWLAVFPALCVLAACNSEPEPLTTQAASGPLDLTAQPQTGRWYSLDEARQGRTLFAENCAACHGQQAVGNPTWQTPDANGQYPAPPLNGSGHGWHHPYAVLHQVIVHGGAPMGGTMPAWGDRLSETEIRRVIAGFQSYWPDEIYQNWLDREQRMR